MIGITQSPSIICAYIRLFMHGWGIHDGDGGRMSGWSRRRRIPLSGGGISLQTALLNEEHRQRRSSGVGEICGKSSMVQDGNDHLRGGGGGGGIALWDPCGSLMWHDLQPAWEGCVAPLGLPRCPPLVDVLLLWYLAWNYLCWNFPGLLYPHTHKYIFAFTLKTTLALKVFVHLSILQCKT